MPSRHVLPGARDLLDLQYGLVRRDQVVGVVTTEDTVRWLLDSGRWRCVLPSVYATFTGALTEDQREVAACLYAGGDAQLTSASALRRHGVRAASADGKVHLLVPHDRRPRSMLFVVIQRTHRLDPAAAPRPPLWLTSVARATADAARSMSEREVVRGLVAEVVQRGLASVAALEDELREGPSRGSRHLRAVLAEVADGARSAPEAELRELLADSPVLPGVIWNPALAGRDGRRLPTPDGWIPEVGLGLEVDSRTFHLSPADWERTLSRHAELAEYGALVLHFTPGQIRRGPGAVRRSVERAYRTRLRAGTRADIRVLP